MLSCFFYSKSPPLCENVHQQALDEHWDLEMIHGPFQVDVPVPEGCEQASIIKRYQNQGQMGFPPQYLICLPDAKSYGGGFAQLHNDQFLVESAWRLNSLLGSESYKTWFRRHRVRLEGDYYHLRSFWGSNYGHWLYEDLPGLLSALPHLPEKIKFLVPDNIESWRRESLYALGIEESQFHPIESYMEAHCERLWFATELGSSREFYTSPEVVQKLRQLLLNHADQHANTDDGGGLRSGERIFISRGNVGNKRLVNEDELAEVAKKWGFTIVSPEKYSFAEQITLFKHANVVVGAFGAALTNILFSKPNAVLVELQEDSPLACPRVWYWKMAHAFGARYKTIIGEYVDYHSWNESSFSIDPQLFAESLTEICTAVDDPESKAPDFFRSASPSET